MTGFVVEKPGEGFFDCMDEMEFFMIMEKMEQLEQKIGYVFQDKMLLRRAITHTSYANEQKINKNGHYERLEFLGDAVLELATSEYLYLKNDEMEEGDMTKLRAALVCEMSLAKSAEEISLNEYILLGKGESAAGGRNRDSIIADVMEAIIGAMYLDGGFEKAKTFISQFILKDLEERQLFFDAKSLLQEYVQKRKTGKLVYKVLNVTGPEHQKTFSCAVLINGVSMGTGTGKNKKEAEQHAAFQAMKALKKR